MQVVRRGLTIDGCIEHGFEIASSEPAEIAIALLQGLCGHEHGGFSSGG